MDYNQNDYSWFKLSGSDKMYFIPEPWKAKDMGAFVLEDTGEVFKVTGVQEFTQPVCLRFEGPVNDLFLTGFREVLPKAYRVNTDL